MCLIERHFLDLMASGSRALQARIPVHLFTASFAHSVRSQAVMQIAPFRALAASRLFS